jgi:hypothetical protein
MSFQSAQSDAPAQGSRECCFRADLVSTYVGYFLSSLCSNIGRHRLQRSQLNLSNLRRYRGPAISFHHTTFHLHVERACKHSLLKPVANQAPWKFPPTTRKIPLHFLSFLPIPQKCYRFPHLRPYRSPRGFRTITPVAARFESGRLRQLVLSRLYPRSTQCSNNAVARL